MRFFDFLIFLVLLGKNVAGFSKPSYKVSQVDFIPVTGLDSGDIMEWNYLDADDDVDTELF